MANQRLEIAAPGVAQLSLRQTGFATSRRGLDRLRRPNPRLDPTGLRPAAQPRTPLDGVG